MSEYDVLAPWGADGPAPVGRWRQDLLGPAYQSRTIELLPDEEGDNVATLVRYRPRKDPGALPGSLGFPRFVALYVHGRNDYFFQTELAQNMAASGAAFYALDLRKYGRSLRPWQSIGFTDDLTTYDEEIGEALDIIREDHGSAPLVLVGHSTGGLITTLWAHRHPGAVHALVLNSAWLEMQSLASLRSAMQPFIGQIAQRSPMWEIPTGGSDFYGRSLVGGWAASGFELPEELRGQPGDGEDDQGADSAPASSDPTVSGWDYAREWKRPESYPVPAAWLDAIMAGHDTVEKKVRLECPVLSMMSTSSYTGEAWSPQVFSSDVVLDADVIALRSMSLSDLVTIARLPGKHDIFLSDPSVRARAYSIMRGWLEAFA
ncbi:alpha/beta hydrolase [Schaalia georgiae]|nr:alpha/beta hydrolase [Schaalia georgiae]